MGNYMGYGFNTNDISSIGFLKFLQTHHPDVVKAYIFQTGIDTDKKVEDLTQKEVEKVCFIIDADRLPYGDSKAEYIASVICGETCDDLVWAEDDFVFFPPLRFPDDAVRKSRYVKNEDDFIALINRFFPGEKISFGSLCLSTCLC